MSYDLPSTFEEGEEENDEDAISMTPREVVQRLQELWKSECACQDLLLYEDDVVDHVTSFYEHQMADTQDNSTDLIGGIVKMEAQRLEYALGRYLGCRIRKVEKYADYLLERDNELISNDKRPHMSSNEKQLAKTIQQISLRHYNSLLDKMPKSVKNMQFMKEGPKPNPETYVFVKVDAEECESSVVNDYGDNSIDIVELKRGQQHLLPFSAVKENLERGEVHAI